MFTLSRGIFLAGILLTIGIFFLFLVAPVELSSLDDSGLLGMDGKTSLQFLGVLAAVAGFAGVNWLNDMSKKRRK
jgi:hypothetical protein